MLKGDVERMRDRGIPTARHAGRALREIGIALYWHSREIAKIIKNGGTKVPPYIGKSE